MAVINFINFLKRDSLCMNVMNRTSHLIPTITYNYHRPGHLTEKFFTIWGISTYKYHAGISVRLIFQ